VRPTLELVAAALLGLTLLWIALEPLVVPDREPDPIDVEMPDDLEATPHGAALVALKDLEFDHATGKLSDQDYHDLKARYTLAAVASLREADAARTGPSGSSGAVPTTIPTPPDDRSTGGASDR
jgi:hypothetical protein